MGEVISNNKRLIKNTLILYLRTFIILFVSLFTVRITFQCLGVEDYGVQNVVSGFVSMFSFVTGSLSVVISRFMSIEIEKKNFSILSNIYSSSIIVLIIIATLIAFVVEAIGIPFLNYKMNIPADRIFAANYVLQFSILTLFLNLISVPFDALIISHEKMSAYAYIGLIDCGLKLLIVYLLYFSNFDKLILYSTLLFIEALIIRIIYSFYCKKAFNGCEFKFKINKDLIKDILIISGWDLWGSSAYILKNYGTNIIINLFCGVSVNAARGIAAQVNTAVTRFSGGFLTAIRPQITKAYTQEDKELFFSLINNGTKFSSFLITIFAIPLIFESHYILTLWLGEIPQYTESFVALMLILSISDGTLIYSHNTALLATGKVKTVQTITGILQLTNLPISYYLLRIGFSPISTLVIAILISQICCFTRVIILNKITGYSIRKFILEVYLKIIMIGLISACIPILITHLMEESLLRLIVTCLTTLIGTGIIILYLGCSINERKRILLFIKTKITK